MQVQESFLGRPMGRAALAALAGLTVLALTGPAPAGPAPAVPAPANNIGNPLCASDGKIDAKKVGPLIAGTWHGEAPGVIPAMGVQHFVVTISARSGHLYMHGGPRWIELRPVQGTRKPLHYDFIHHKPLPKSAWGTKATLDDLQVAAACELGMLPQFSWTFGTGGRTSAGIYSFLMPGIAVGTMWNSAGGMREVQLTKVTP